MVLPRGGLSLAHKQAIARRYLKGEPKSSFVGFAGLTLPALKRLFLSQSFRDVLAAEQGHLDGLAARARMKLALGAEDAADRMVERGGNKKSPNLAFNADKFVLDSILPRREEVVTHNTHTIEPRVVSEIAEGVSKVIDLFKGKSVGDISKYTLHGLTGVETVEASVAAQELVTVPEPASPKESSDRTDPSPPSGG